MRLRIILWGLLLSFFSLEVSAGHSFTDELQNPQKPINKKTRIQPSANKKEAAAQPEAKSADKKAIASERYIALKTNIAYDAIAIPNLAVEMQFSKHISVELPVMLSFWDLTQKRAIRTIAIQPEARWWMRQAGAGHFFGVHVNVGWFNAKWEDDRYQSTDRPLLGAGLSYGYLLPLSTHWGAEFTLGAGYANMKYDTYYNIDNGAKIGTESRNYWGITRIGLSLSYRF